MRDAESRRAVIVCTGYDRASHFKDPGLIAAELQWAGYDVTCLVAQKGLAGIVDAAYSVELIPGSPCATATWSKYPADIFLIYFIDATQLEWVNIIRKNNPHSRIILKCDSDGLISTGMATPRSKLAQYQRGLVWFREIGSPRAMFQHPFSKAPLRIVAHLAWLVTHQRPADVRRIQKLQEYLELFDRIVIESTEAAQNLLLNFPGVAEKTVVIPNGVSRRRSSLSDHNNKKIIAVGRFTDYQAKRPAVLCRVLCRFLATQPDWTVDIVGPYDAKLEGVIERARPFIRERVHLHGPRTNNETRAAMADSTIYFSASAYESFGIAMAEALCEGCSVVSTPVPSAWDLVAGGMSGTVAATFTEDDLVAALAADAEKWSTGKYDRARIASYWRPRLDWSELTRSILGDAEDVENLLRQKGQ